MTNAFVKEETDRKKLKIDFSDKQLYFKLLHFSTLFDYYDFPRNSPVI